MSSSRARTPTGTSPIPLRCCTRWRLLGAAPARAVYVGDAPYDLRAGRGAGVATAAAMWGTAFAAAVLRAERPDRELADPRRRSHGDRGGPGRRAAAR